MQCAGVVFLGVQMTRTAHVNWQRNCDAVSEKIESRHSELCLLGRVNIDVMRASPLTGKTKKQTRKVCLTYMH